MTFVFGLAIGAVLGALFISSREASEPDPAPPASEAQAMTEQLAVQESQLAERDREIEGLQAELERMRRDFEGVLASGGEPGELQLARDEAAAKQAEIDSLSVELGAALQELSRLQSVEPDGNLITQYVLVLQELHAFAQNDYRDGPQYADDPALNDALDEIADPSLTEAVLNGLSESSPADTDGLYLALQMVLNQMQAQFVA